jgi:hypothetical protein
VNGIRLHATNAFDHPEGIMSAASFLTPETVLRNYFHAKDENRPYLLSSVFTPGARLEVLNRASTISFPTLSTGREAIADVLVRSFGRAYENVHSFYLARPAAAARSFSCDWLVAMSEKDERSVRVGCGRYDWAFDERAPGLATSLTISLEVMQVLPPDALERSLEWVLQLDYPWSSAPAAVECAPGMELLAPVLQYLARHAKGA